jgi:ATP-dependent protease HslVU (ClpYQ) peptidase subunit
VTSIVYRDGILASDSQMAAGNAIIPGGIKKIHKLPDGSLYAFSGPVELGHAMRLYLMDPEDQTLPDFTGANHNAYSGLILSSDGQLLCYDTCCWYNLKLPYYAMGSGDAFAYGALAVGASAQQACKAAIGLDTNSGGRIRTVVWPQWKGKGSYVEQKFRR